MQSFSGAAVMGVVQQPNWTTGSIFPHKMCSNAGFPSALRLNLAKHFKTSSIVASLMIGRTSSSMSVPMPETAGDLVDYGLDEADPELFEILGKEKERQFTSLELIASENYTSRAVMEGVGSCLTNK